MPQERTTDLLRSQGRVSYGALKRQFNLDDDYLEEYKEELIEAQRVAAALIVAAALHHLRSMVACWQNGVHLYRYCSYCE
jgi:hypothetical protein